MILLSYSKSKEDLGKWNISFAFAREPRVSHSFFLKLQYWLASCSWRLKYLRKISGSPNILWSLTKQPHKYGRIKVTSWILTGVNRKEEIMAQQPKEGPYLCSKAKGDVCCTSWRAAFFSITADLGIRSKLMKWSGRFGYTLCGKWPSKQKIHWWKLYSLFLLSILKHFQKNVSSKQFNFVFSNAWKKN